MSCPSLEEWLEAIDTGAEAPDTAHADCASCDALRVEATELIAAVRAAAPAPEYDDEVFVARVLRATERVKPAPRRRLLGWALAAAAPLAAAASVVFVLATRSGPGEDGPVARGGRDAAPWCEVAVVHPEGLQFVGDGAHLPADASLAFRVRHEGPEPAWLGIVGISERGEVGWFYPAYESAQDDPQTLRIDPSPAPKLLPQRVSLPLGTGRVRIVCWKSDHAWPVKEADALFERAATAPGAPDRIPELGGSQSGVDLWFGEDP